MATPPRRSHLDDDPMVGGSIEPSTNVDDLVFRRMQREAEDVIRLEPTMAAVIYSTILNHDSFESVVVHRIASRLAHPDVQGALIGQSFLDLLSKDGEFFRGPTRRSPRGVGSRPGLHAGARADPVFQRLSRPPDPSAGARVVGRAGRHDFAFYLQSRSSALFQTDIHPAAQIGKGILLDHATSLMVGSSSVIEDDVSMLHHVTLGGTGRDAVERHPKIGRGVLIGAGAKILGNIDIGFCSRIAAGSVVLDSVPHNKTVAGVPARIVADTGCSEPARTIEEVLAAKPATGIGTGRNIIQLRGVYVGARDPNR